jgi:hypothetical protein
MKAKLNGIEIREGQYWKCTGGEIVEIVCVRKRVGDETAVVGGYLPKAHKIVTLDSDDFVKLLSGHEL